MIRELVTCVRRMALHDEIKYSDRDIAEYMYSCIRQLKAVSEFTIPRDNIVGVQGDFLIVDDKAILDPVVQKTDDISDFIDEMYALYPARCPKRNSSLGKSHKDKERIKRLLKIYTKEEVEQVIRNEVDSNYGINYMKNFSTFLNNFPEPSKESESPITQTTSSDKLIIGGVEYK